MLSNYLQTDQQIQIYPFRRSYVCVWIFAQILDSKMKKNNSSHFHRIDWQQKRQFRFELNSAQHKEFRPTEFRPTEFRPTHPRRQATQICCLCRKLIGRGGFQQILSKMVFWKIVKSRLKTSPNNSQEISYSVLFCRYTK